jgi:hypothetical protein
MHNQQANRSGREGEKVGAAPLYTATYFPAHNARYYQLPKY